MTNTATRPAVTGPLCPVCQHYRCATKRTGGYFPTCYNCREAPAPASPPPAAPQAAAPPRRAAAILPIDDAADMRRVAVQASHAARVGRPAACTVAPIIAENFLTVEDDGECNITTRYPDEDGYQGHRWCCTCGYRGGFPCEHVHSVLVFEASVREQDYQAQYS